MSLDPIRTTQAVTEGYFNYLSTTFRLRDHGLQQQFEELLQFPEKFVKGPILEATPPFETGPTLEDLIQEGLLSPHFRTLNSDHLPLDRLLYKHQEQAIRNVVARARNLVVATGTGSGKTEAFLIPILNHLYLEEEDNKLTPGVRALLLYPMNALANDQLSRLRQLLHNQSHITFGRYTGETEEHTDKAIDRYRKMFQREPLSNELISRQQMRVSPPHILLTNYAMLEYLLLRPTDNVFFDGEFAVDWRFLVIDEAHTYTGAKGIEMAMLLRRLKDRVVGGEQERLLCIATSATLGRGKEDFPEVARFANQIFNEKFDWDDGEVSKQDVVQAERKRSLFAQQEVTWTVDPALYQRWLEIVNEQSGSEAIEMLIKVGREAGAPNDIFQQAIHAGISSEPAEFLFHVLKNNEHLAVLRQALDSEPRYVGNMATQLFGEHPQARDWIVALVDLSVRAKSSVDDQPLLPARYHLFVRTIEGAYISLLPDRRLYLDRREKVKLGDDAFAVFELATCRQCGTGYLVGEREEFEGKCIFKQPGKQTYEQSSKLEYFLLLEEDVQRVPDDEDEIVSYGDDIEDIASDRYKLCASCGAIDRENLLTPICDCAKDKQISLLLVSSKKGRVHVCPACGSRSPTGLVRRFLTGNDATASVLATSLYQQIPPREDVTEISIPGPDESAWSSTAGAAATKSIHHTLKGEGRQLLIFSDSRQDAAFFAPYLSRTYHQILRRRLILQVLDDQKERVISNCWRAQDLITPLQKQASKLGIFSGMSQQEQEGEAWKWVLYEMLALDRRNSLEGLGCLGFSLVRPEQWAPPKPLLEWGLSEEEVWILFQILLDTLRMKGAVLFPDAVSPKDEFFSPRNRESYFRESGSDSKKNILSWNPSGRGRTNARLDFLLRFMQRGLGRDVSREEGIEILSNLWRQSLALHDPTSCWKDYFSSFPMRGEDIVFRMKHTIWELNPTLIDPSIKWNYCPKCNNLKLLTLRGVCSTYQCDGELRSVNPTEVFSDNHYRRLFTTLKPIDLVVHEHTAQLTGEAAAELQTKFIQGDVNVLSCSTTFELGVDVGQLETVFMRNVPPSAANYIQRAGRAGRRTSSTAFALTFAQRRPHDLAHFSNPKRMITGEIRAPYFEIANEKIVQRHIYASALAAFWRQYPDTFGKVASFFFRAGVNGPDLMKEYLTNRPESLRVSIDRIVPAELKEGIGIDDWRWVDSLLGDEDGVLNKAAERVVGDVEQLNGAREKLISQNKPSDYMLRVINTIQKRDLINFLSSQNVIPKYGFPVDVVNLQILHHADEAKGLELDRDLRIALSEYAPSSEVVAGGKQWTSRYLKRLPDRAWRRYKYAVCSYCQRYQRVLADVEEELEICDACNQPLTGKDRGVFVIPEFGFITTSKPPAKPGDSRPQRTYSTRTYFSGDSKESESVSLDAGGIRIVGISASEGKMAVINRAGYQGFKVCTSCGFTMLGSEKHENPHLTPWRTECRGILTRLFLGHEFMTDVLQLRFEGYANADRGFWLSLLYALMEGMSAALEIDRRDLDGTLYSYAGDPTAPALVLYDEVPGGAGHVRRVIKEADSLLRVLRATLDRMKQCDCGGELLDTSCYGCLRNYRNQFCHDELKRGPIVKFLSTLLGKEYMIGNDGS